MAQPVNTLNWRFDHLVIGYFLGNVPLGYYSVGDNLTASPTRAAITPVAQTLFPAMARLTGDVQHLRQAYQRAQSLMLAVALPLGCGFAIVAEPLVLLTMGEKWSHAITIIQLLAAIFALQTLSSAVQPLAMAMGQTRMLFNRDLVNWFPGLLRSIDCFWLRRRLAIRSRPSCWYPRVLCFLWERRSCCGGAWAGQQVRTRK